MTTDITELALIDKIQKQLENFDTVVLKEDEANALVEALEKAQQQIIAFQQRHEDDPRTHEIIDLKERITELESEVEKWKQESEAWEQVAEKQLATAIELESRTVTVKLPFTPEPSAFAPWVAKAFYQFHKDTVKSCFSLFSDACTAAGIKVEAE